MYINLEMVQIQTKTPHSNSSSGVAQVAAGQFHSLILKTDGSLHAFGKIQTVSSEMALPQVNTPTQILASGVAKLR